MKIRFNISIDANLKEIINTYSKNNNTTMSDLIAEAIAEKLEIPLNNNNGINNEVYAAYQIKQIENTINKLTNEKQQYEALL